MPENYQLKLDKELVRIASTGAKPRLLLHVCCAPCSSYVLEYLHRHFDITVLFYNPNIAPEAEYQYRAQELLRLTTELPLSQPIRCRVEPYDSTPFYAFAKELEDAPEGGIRCTECYRLRLTETAKIAAADGFDYFTTTLSISPLKDAERLNSIGGELAQEYDVPYLFSDFKKREGYKRSIQLSNEYHLYRQDYCGCVYSKRDAELRKQSKI